MLLFFFSFFFKLLTNFPTTKASARLAGEILFKKVGLEASFGSWGLQCLSCPAVSGRSAGGLTLVASLGQSTHLYHSAKITHESQNKHFGTR